MEATMSRGTNSWVRLAASVGFTILAACTSPKPMPIDAYHVDFDTDSYSIQPAGQQAIASVAQRVAGNGDAKVTIVGRTDAAGTPAYNMQLSQKRAAAVHDALIATGKIAPDQIQTTWTGEKQQSTAAGATPPPGDKVVDIYVH
jgi:outer membrane protein OmpA-like peptidoglycan-associated protein